MDPQPSTFGKDWKAGVVTGCLKWPFATRSLWQHVLIREGEDLRPSGRGNADDWKEDQRLTIAPIGSSV